MKTFKLPDLGEGLPDAIIREWYVKAGDTVKTDQTIVAMETAKALVDVPAPFSGKIEKLFGEAGDTIETGQALIGFEGADESSNESKDSGTVVGAIEESDMVLEESATGITYTRSSTAKRPRALPAVRLLAAQLGIDLANITPKGDHITVNDLQLASKQLRKPTNNVALTGEITELSPVRKAMALSMAHSHSEVVSVTLVDDADIHAWTGKQDITVRLIRAIAATCTAIPIMNAYFDGHAMAYQLNEAINIGLAIDTPHGLYVPVIKDINNLTDKKIRTEINRLKQLAQDKAIPQKDLHGATIILSNFGALAGRYANPILIPPMTGIIGVGKSRDEVVATDGKPAVHRIMPLSITVDHRAVTGGEAARSLKTLIDELGKAAL